MNILVLNHREVEQLLPMRECIEVMADALARGEAYQPLRSGILPPNAKGLMGLMPAYLANETRALYGLKAICVFPANPARSGCRDDGGGAAVCGSPRVHAE